MCLETWGNRSKSLPIVIRVYLDTHCESLIDRYTRSLGPWQWRGTKQSCFEQTSPLGMQQKPQRTQKYLLFLFKIKTRIHTVGGNKIRQTSWYRESSILSRLPKKIWDQYRSLCYQRCQWQVKVFISEDGPLLQAILEATSHPARWTLTTNRVIQVVNPTSNWFSGARLMGKAF